jgi:hypothetical protein
MLPIIVTATSAPPLSTELGYPIPGAYQVAGTGTDIRWSFVFEESPLGLDDLQFAATDQYSSLWARYVSGSADKPGVFGDWGPSLYDAVTTDWDLVSYDAFGLVDGTVRWTGLLYPKGKPSPGQGMWDAYVPETGGAFDFEVVPDNISMRSAWARPELVVPEPFPNGAGRYASAIFHDTVFEPWPDDMADENYDAGVKVVGPIPFGLIQARSTTCGLLAGYPTESRLAGSQTESHPVACCTRAR